MILLKRRSRSESRKVGIAENQQRNDAQLPEDITRNGRQQHQPQQQRRSRTQVKRPPLERMETVPGMGRRKTSAELISEAKMFLGNINTSNSNLIPNQTASVGGVRLLNTRRPITPRESGRALYGKVALAGRPPSAVSLRYLQNEGLRAPKTPSLEPIKSQGSLDVDTATEERLRMHPKTKRSNSLDMRNSLLTNETRFGDFNSKVRSDNRPDNDVGIIGQTKGFPKKLPALEVKGVAVGGNMDTKQSNANSNNFSNDSSDRMFSQKEQDTFTDMNATNKAISLLTSRKLLTRNFDVMAQSSTEKLIELLKEHAGLKDCTAETVQHINSILIELYERVRRSEKSFKRGFILGGLYGLVECSSPKILLAVARVVLALRVTGSNLTGACKLIFKVARNEQNDTLFHDNDLLELLIDGLGRASPLDDPEACIYGYGSIRFLTSASGQERCTDVQAIRDINKNSMDYLQLPRKPATAPAGGKKLSTCEILQAERYQKLTKQCTLLERLARHGAVELMVLHLQILNEAGATQKLTGPPLHSLYQLSAALRALADVRQISSSLEKENDNDDNTGCESYMGNKINAATVELELACPHLIRAAEISIGELEVQANIVRTLSILSEDEDCCKVLANFVARIGILLGPCLELFNGASEKLLSLFSRLGYILGNIVAKYDMARIQFYHNDVAMEYLLKVMQLYTKEPLTLHNAMGDTVGDVLIKMIRVVANMSVNSEVGFGLGNTHTLGGLLLQQLNATYHVKTAKEQSESQELTLATLGALHNLCFYQDKNSMPTQVIESKGSLQSVLLDVTTALCITLRTCNDPVVEVEAARVLGNITRNDKARKYFCKAGGLPLILHSLQRQNREVEALNYELKACATGVLVNLLGDVENRTPFLQLDGVAVLMDLLKLVLEKKHDWFLATIICQAFWNLLIDAPSMTDICEERVLDDMCDLLSDYLDDELLFDGVDDPEPDLLWEGFAMVATDLLERIQNNFEQQNQEQLLLYVRGEQENDDEDDVYIEEM